jgi:precorrin-6Y C5,15-methyltransferase (decarboxylating)
MGTSANHLNAGVLKAIESAEVLIGDRRHLKLFDHLPCQKIPLKRNLDEILRIIEDRRRDVNIVVLASGDPNFFGIAKLVRAKLNKKHVEVIPNVTSLQSAFAKINESWEDAYVVSLHGRETPSVAHLLERHPKLFLLTDRKNNPSAIARRIVRDNRGLSGVKAYVLENLGTKQERITVDQVANLRQRHFDILNVMILMREDVPCEIAVDQPVFGLPDEEFQHEKGMITKPEVRAVTLAKLRLTHHCLLWDIGAASGSISVEASLLFPDIQVYAVERSSKRFSQLGKNITKFNAGNVTPVLGEAPKVLASLPAPHRVFIGGSGGKLPDIIAYCKQALLPGGRIVINAATAQTLRDSLSQFEQKRWKAEATLLSIARTEKVNEHHRFQALNPVFIIQAERHT